MTTGQQSPCLGDILRQLTEKDFPTVGNIVLTVRNKYFPERITWIKEYRQIAGCTLMEAKNAFESGVLIRENIHDRDKVIRQSILEMQLAHIRATGKLCHVDIITLKLEPCYHERGNPE